MNSDLHIPCNPATPRQLIKILNDGIFAWHTTSWERIADHVLYPPEFTPGFCLTKRCPNAAIIYGYCTRCTTKREKVEVKRSTLHIPTNPVGLGLFATKEFQGGQYICAFCWNMGPAEGGTIDCLHAHADQENTFPRVIRYE